MKVSNKEKRKDGLSATRLRIKTRKMIVATTGAFTYSGRYLTQLLLESGRISELRNLTNHPDRKWDNVNDKFKAPKVQPVTDSKIIKTFPLKFENQEELVNSLKNVDVLVCTYWTRFIDQNGQIPGLANVRKLIDACVEANVRKVVYVSHTKTSVDSDITYIRSKALAEEYIKQNIKTYAFVRPCCIFGDTAHESILVNNTAYFMRRMPALLFSGDIKQKYFQPVHVRDMSQMLFEAIFDDNRVDYDAVGPEKLTFFEFASAIKDSVGPRMFGQPYFLYNSAFRPHVVYRMAQPINFFAGDTFIDEGELDILDQNLACSDGDPKDWGKIPFTKWVAENGTDLGVEYVSSTKRYYDRPEK